MVARALNGWMDGGDTIFEKLINNMLTVLVAKSYGNMRDGWPDGDIGFEKLIKGVLTVVVVIIRVIVP